MNLIVWLISGGIIGWIASLLMRTDGEQGVILNVLVGIVGAAIGGWLISPMVGIPSINQDALSLGALVVSLLGAVVLLAIVNLIRRGTLR
ncbi:MULTISPECIES: GlsB/YeaQ/YmgE family stress response membrane protein [unclassified Roseateles]|uniref:GlsB/YeaQ/YmgE family stress response membrane protein n=1 Tax=Pelomonas sp. Root1237 TaxID=1736434 RepID=UPI000700E93B|nr:GlsB/YeaQ/YmgE family stress response membrane protein [Pelomonas sp. Root1237]KQV89442.1 transglycosylase [Pelomonas sp. Root1237]